jgi:exosome complex exonuclease DIS3/RRP44
LSSVTTTIAGIAFSFLPFLDMISESKDARDSKETTRGELFYPEYFSMSKLTTGLRACNGAVTVIAAQDKKRFVESCGLDGGFQVVVRRNIEHSLVQCPAIAGDSVVVEVLPQDQWKSPSTKIVDEEAVTRNDNCRKLRS